MKPGLSGMVGFTPTRVGTARAQGQHRPLAAVHPHASGDSFWVWSRVRRRRGSPPREWGQRPVNRSNRAVGGFTPTRVGTALEDHYTSSAITVHPHASGDSPMLI